MHSPDHIVTVELGDDSYPIHIAAGALTRAGALMKPHLSSQRVLVVADAHVAATHAEALLKSFAAAGLWAAIETFPAGETSKSLTTADHLWQACARHRIDRQDAIVALGGGVSGDLAGFVAASWMRGVRFVQVPTSLLAMVDSSVGGKTGVNATAGKNLIGAFKHPVCVIIDPTLLATMDRREYRSGLAEVLKYGVIRDAAFFAWQEQHAEALAHVEADAVAHAVAESCRIKAAYVAADPFERGIRAHLNYGHTFGHALERDTDYTRYRHGEAVAIGMRMATQLAQRLGTLRDATLATRQDALLTRYGLPLTHACAPLDVTAKRLAGHCALDKKVAAGRTRFVLPTHLGEVVISDAPDADDVIAAFTFGLTTA